MDYSKPFKYFTEIARQQSISLAAEKLNIQQPALSQYLKKIETELGIELFNRSTNPIQLTDAGKSFLVTANKIIDADIQLKKKLRDIKNQPFTLRVGISPSRAPYLLPIILKDFTIACPNTNIETFETSTEKLNSGLTHGLFDLIISVFNNGTQNFTKCDLFEEKILLAVPKSVERESFESVLKNNNIISFGKGQLLTNFLSALPKHCSHIECQNIISALSLVKAGLGVALVPSYMKEFGTKNDVEFLTIPPDLCRASQRQVCIFFRNEQYLSKSEKIFLCCAKKSTCINN